MQNLIFVCRLQMVGIHRYIVSIEFSQFLGEQSRREMFAHAGEFTHRIWEGTFDEGGFEVRDVFRFVPQFIGGIGVSASWNDISNGWLDPLGAGTGSDCSAGGDQARLYCINSN